MKMPGTIDPYVILSRLLEERTGQVLLPNRHWRLEMALKPVMRSNSVSDLNSLGALLALDADPHLARECVEAMINNETCFFRDQANFALLTGPVLDSIREHRAAEKRIRIWSAACSTGQEPYSLAMAFAQNSAKWQGWNVQIIATDISNSALAQAKSGRYSQFEIQRGLPVMLMLKHFTQDRDAWTAREELRRAVTFFEHNMLKSPRHLGMFDIILCRNMLMYLGDDKRTEIFDSLGSALAPDGILMLGAAETVIGHTRQFAASREFRGFYKVSGGDGVSERASQRMSA